MNIPCYKCLVFPVCRQRLIENGINMVQYTDSLVNGNKYMHKNDFIYILASRLTIKCYDLKKFFIDRAGCKESMCINEFKELYGIEYHPEEPLY